MSYGGILFDLLVSMHQGHKDPMIPLKFRSYVPIYSVIKKKK